MSSTLRLFWEAAGGNVPEHWEFKTIDELLEHPKAISVGVMYPGSDSDGGVPLIKVSDVKSGAIASRPSFCISNKVDEEYKRTRLNGSELLLTLVGNPGDCVIVTDEMCGWNVARALAVIRLKDTQLRSWIRYVLASKPAQHLIEARLNTTVQKTLNLKDVREIGIPIPPKEERDSITKTIDSIEKKTLINTKINQTLESIAQAIFKSWFIDFEPVRAKIAAKLEGADPEIAAMCVISGKSEAELKKMPEDDFAELQATAALFPDELVESELGEVPNGWFKTDLSILADLNVQSWTKKNCPEKVTYVDLSNTKWGTIQQTEEFIFEKAPSRARRVLKIGDTIVGTVRPANGSYAFIQRENLTGSTGFAVLSPKKVIYAEFIYIASTDEENIKRLAHLADGGAYPAVSYDTVLNTPCILPIKDNDRDGILNLFHKNVKVFYLFSKSKFEENKTLENTRDSLLPKLLSGEMDVSGLQIEVA